MTDRIAELLDALRERGLSLAVAESLTGGALSAAIVGVPGASDVLRGAVVAYATPIKAALLAVDADLLAAHGAVHPDVAAQMARGVRTVLAIEGIPADLGLATTGVAGPAPQDGQPVGTVFIAAAIGDRCTVRRLALAGDRGEIRAATVAAAIELAHETLRDPRE